MSSYVQEVCKAEKVKPVEVVLKCRSIEEFSADPVDGGAVCSAKVRTLAESAENEYRQGDCEPYGGAPPSMILVCLAS